MQNPELDLIQFSSVELTDDEGNKYIISGSIYFASKVAEQ